MADSDKVLLQEVISKDKWIVPLERFIQVLRINIFVVDDKGVPVIHPCGTSRSDEYGCRILTRFLSLEQVQNGGNFLKQFSAYGDYLECCSDLKLHSFAIPLKVYGRIVAYMIVGPVIMNKRLSNEEYFQRAEQRGLLAEELLNELGGVRVVSYVAMNAILDLLAAITRDFIEISLENRRLKKMRFQKEVLPKAITEAAEGLYREIHVDELLISVLDVALKLTNAEVGSIMVFDKGSKEMMIRVSRGLSDECVKNTRARVGEGVAGMAAKENRCFILHGQKSGNNRLEQFLKRPEIKESMVVPISHQNRVFGVLNLHSKLEGSRIEMNAGYLMSLSKLLSTAVFS